MMTIPATSSSPACTRMVDPGAMMLGAMQSGLRSIRSRLFFSRNDSIRMFNLRRRRGFGSLHHGDGRRSNRVPYTLCSWHGDHEQTWSAIPLRDIRDQRFGIILDRPADDSAHRTASAPSELAITTGGWFPWWLHHFLKLRMGNAQPGERWWPVARFTQHHRKRIARIRRRLAGIDDSGKAVIRSI